MTERRKSDRRKDCTECSNFDAAREQLPKAIYKLESLERELDRHMETDLPKITEQFQALDHTLRKHMEDEMSHHGKTDAEISKISTNVHWIVLIGKWMIGVLVGYLITLGVFSYTYVTKDQQYHRKVERRVNTNRNDIIGFKKDLSYLVRQFGGKPASEVKSSNGKP